MSTNTQPLVDIENGPFPWLENPLISIRSMKSLLRTIYGSTIPENARFLTIEIDAHASITINVTAFAHDPSTGSNVLVVDLLRDYIVSRFELFSRKVQAFVLWYRFGLDGEKERTLEETGELLGVSRERIRQIESKALAILRHPNRLEQPVLDLSDFPQLTGTVSDKSLPLSYLHLPVDIYNSLPKDSIGWLTGFSQVEFRREFGFSKQDIETIINALRNYGFSLRIDFHDNLDVLPLMYTCITPLVRRDIATIRDLCGYTAAELEKVPGIGPRKLELIQIALARTPFSLKE